MITKVALVPFLFIYFGFTTTKLKQIDWKLFPFVVWSLWKYPKAP